MNEILVIVALVFVLIVVCVGAWVVVKVPDAPNAEIAKVRFAAATFAGLLAIIVLVIILRYVSPTGVGKDIFSIVFPTINTLAGALIGYLFGTNANKPAGS